MLGRGINEYHDQSFKLLEHIASGRRPSHLAPFWGPLMTRVKVLKTKFLVRELVKRGNGVP